MPPPNNGNEDISFATLMALESTSKDQFRSTALAFGPANGTRAYGGHVFAQACYAASRTVGKKMVLNNVTGWFLLAGKTNERFTFTVRRIRDGGFTTRGVDVVQESDPGFCFTCVCSFKRAEKATSRQVDIRQEIDLQKEFGSALGDRKPTDHPEMLGIDAPWYWEYARKHSYNDPFPGLQLHKVDMEGWNRARLPLERRTLKYYAVKGEMPSVEEDANLHACAHLYASDRNSLFVM